MDGGIKIVRQLIGCAGGGSNLGGLIAPFMGEKLQGKADYRFIAVEPASCPTLTRGVYAYDYCDTGNVCPLQKMYTLGSGFIPSSSHAGGLRYHGMSSTLSQLYHDGLMEAITVQQAQELYLKEQKQLDKMRKIIHKPCKEVLECRLVAKRLTKLFEE